MKIFVIRHPQTYWNLERKLQWHLDSDLTQFWIETANKLAENLKNKNITKIISSDLWRCRQTADIASQKLNLNYKTDKLLRERDLGQYNWCYWEDLPKDLDIHNYNFIVPSWESLKQTQSRAINFIENIHKNYDLEENDVLLLVVHSWIMKALVSYAQDKHFTDKLNNTTQQTIWEFELKNNKLSLINKWEVK